MVKLCGLQTPLSITTLRSKGNGYQLFMCTSSHARLLLLYWNYGLVPTGSVVACVDVCNFKVYLVLFGKLAGSLVSSPEYLVLASVLKIDMIDR